MGLCSSTGCPSVLSGWFVDNLSPMKFLMSIAEGTYPSENSRLVRTYELIHNAIRCGMGHPHCKPPHGLQQPVSVDQPHGGESNQNSSLTSLSGQYRVRLRKRSTISEADTLAALTRACNCVYTRPCTHTTFCPALGVFPKGTSAHLFFNQSWRE